MIPSCTVFPSGYWLVNVCWARQHAYAVEEDNVGVCQDFYFYFFYEPEAEIKVDKTLVIRSTPFIPLGDHIWKVGAGAPGGRPGKMKEHDLTLMLVLDFKHCRQQQWRPARKCNVQPASARSSVTSNPPFPLMAQLVGVPFVCKRGDQRMERAGSL